MASAVGGAPVLPMSALPKSAFLQQPQPPLPQSVQQQIVRRHGMSFWQGKAQTLARQKKLPPILQHVMPVHVSQCFDEQQTHPSLPRWQQPVKQL